MGPVAIVVIGRNEAQTIGACIDTARRATLALGGGEILLVDSASEDGTPEIGLRTGARVVRVVRASRFCPAAMRYIGAGLVRAPFIMFLDADCILEDGFLQAGLRRMQSEPDLGVLAGKRRDFYRVGDTTLPAAEDFYSRPRILAPGQPAYGGCALYRSEALLKAGSFNPFLGAREEEELAFRIQRAGFRTEVIDLPMIRHMTVQRESRRRLARSLRHGFFVGRGQAARLSLSRGLYRSALHGLDRPIATLVHLLLGAACLVVGLNGTWWPLMLWTGLSALALLAFLVRTRSPLRVAYYVTEWVVQGVLLVVGFMMPRRDPATFRWEGEEYAQGRTSNPRLMSQRVG